MRLTLAGFLFSPMVLLGQTFCAPGATWAYALGGIQLSDAHGHSTYLGDTLVNGEMLKHVEEVTQGIDPYNNSLVSFTTQKYFLVDGDLVSVYTPTFGWDTLIRFNAVPGEFWHRPGQQNDTLGQWCSQRIMVSDTGRVDFEGFTLRTLVLTQYRGSESRTTRVTERIQLPFSDFWPVCVVSEGNSTLCAYRDDELGSHYYFPDWSYCDFAFNEVVTSIDSAAQSIFAIQLHGRSLTVLSEEQGTNYNMRIIDGSGRIIKQHSNVSTPFSTDLSSNANGLYVIQLINSKSGVRYSERIVLR